MRGTGAGPKSDGGGGERSANRKREQEVLKNNDFTFFERVTNLWQPF